MHGSSAINNLKPEYSLNESIDLISMQEKYKNFLMAEFFTKNSYQKNFFLRIYLKFYKKLIN